MSDESVQQRHDGLVQQMRDESATWRPSRLTELCMEAADCLEDYEIRCDHYRRCNDWSQARIRALEATLRGIAGSSVRPGTAAFELQQIAARALEGKP